ncbi:MAG TPA: NfeD family protein, partial [Symbiobacteriaceae bacterium]|nr:NfeD family protein [Symbiobacteriaceae bacterium]
QEKELLVLTAKEAVEKHFANGYAADLSDALKQAGIEFQQMHEVVPTMSESFGRLLTTPWVAIMLLVVGVIAIGIEFIKPGVTVPGLVGVVSLTLFFLGNMLVGTAGWVELGLALLGILLLVIEAFIPGFGIFGTGGIIAVGASIFLSVPTPEMAMQYLMWTSFAFAIALFGIIRAVSRRGLGKALTLKSREVNYVPARADLGYLIGMEGRTISVLRPAGSAFFGNDRVDVVTEGEFIPAGTTIKVIRVDGARVVVRSAE